MICSRYGAWYYVSMLINPFEKTIDYPWNFFINLNTHNKTLFLVFLSECQSTRFDSDFHSIWNVLQMCLVRRCVIPNVCHNPAEVHWHWTCGLVGEYNHKRGVVKWNQIKLNNLKLLSFSFLSFSFRKFSVPCMTSTLVIHPMHTLEW